MKEHGLIDYEENRDGTLRFPQTIAGSVPSIFFFFSSTIKVNAHTVTRNLFFFSPPLT